MTRRSALAIACGIGLSWLVVRGLAILAVVATTPVHDADDGANMAGVWGYLIGPVVAAAIVGFAASRWAVRRARLIGYAAAFIAAASSAVPSLASSARDYPEYAVGSVATELVVSLITALLVSPAVLLGARRAQQAKVGSDGQDT